MKYFLDWTETLLCNAEPMSHCPKSEWDTILKRWRDEKHREFPDRNCEI